MQMRAFDPEKCGSAGSGKKKTERVEKGNAWSPYGHWMPTGCHWYLSGCGSWRQENAAQVIKLFKDARGTDGDAVHGIAMQVLAESPF